MLNLAAVSGFAFPRNPYYFEAIQNLKFPFLKVYIEPASCLVSN